MDLQEVISKIENPFKIDNITFSYNTFYNATLYVPTGTIDKYKTTRGWKKFVFIEEGSPSDITDVESEGVKDHKRYSLDGRVVNESHKGITIIKMDSGEVKKVIVR